MVSYRDEDDEDNQKQPIKAAAPPDFFDDEPDSEHQGEIPEQAPPHHQQQLKPPSKSLPKSGKSKKGKKGKKKKSGNGRSRSRDGGGGGEGRRRNNNDNPEGGGGDDGRQHKYSTADQKESGKCKKYALILLAILIMILIMIGISKLMEHFFYGDKSDNKDMSEYVRNPNSSFPLDKADIEAVCSRGSISIDEGAACRNACEPVYYDCCDPFNEFVLYETYTTEAPVMSNETKEDDEDDRYPGGLGAGDFGNRLNSTNETIPPTSSETLPASIEFVPYDDGSGSTETNNDSDIHDADLKNSTGTNGSETEVNATGTATELNGTGTKTELNATETETELNATGTEIDLNATKYEDNNNTNIDAPSNNDSTNNTGTETNPDNNGNDNKNNNENENPDGNFRSRRLFVRRVSAYELMQRELERRQDEEIRELQEMKIEKTVAPVWWQDHKDKMDAEIAAKANQTCSLDNELQGCLRYAKCQALTMKVDPAPAGLADYCNTTLVKTDPVTCQSLCAPAACCWAEDSTNCMARDFDICLDYASCQNLRLANTDASVGSIVPAASRLLDFYCFNNQLECQTECKIAECCSNSNSLCYRNNFLSCLTYAPCNNVTKTHIHVPKQFGYLEKPPDAILQACNPNRTVYTLEATDSCSSICEAMSCCLEADPKNSCFMLDPLGCLAWEDRCQILLDYPDL